MSLTCSTTVESPPGGGQSADLGLWGRSRLSVADLRLPCAEVTLKEVGLEGALFTLLDQEWEPGLRRSIQEVLVHMMASSSTSGKLGHWLKLCKDVLSASTGGCLTPPPPPKPKSRPSRLLLAPDSSCRLGRG